MNGLQAEARQLLQRAVQELVSFASPKATVHSGMMRRLLEAPGRWSRKPGDPVSCPALQRTFTAASLQQLVALLPKT